MGTVVGRYSWGLSRDDEGHRTYDITWMVRMNSTTEGPTSAMLAAGLPEVGAVWDYGADYDVWALCTPVIEARPFKTANEPGRYWLVTQSFSTVPRSRCQDETVEDPLVEPAKISGSFRKFRKEIQKDRNGDPVVSSSHEILTGGVTEFDHNKPTVSIEMNFATLPLATYAEYMDSVNDATLWGLDARKIKLSNASWRRNLYGLCNFYYTVNYEFDIDFNTFDTVALDEGWRKLGPNGDETNPDDFVRHQDLRGHYAKTLLDGAGSPLPAGDIPVEIDIEYYPEKNLLLLGIPSEL